jgi:acetyl esterase/lipase
MKLRHILFTLLVTLSIAEAQSPQPPPLPAGVKAMRDLAYVEKGHERQKLDLYLPEKADGPLPLIIWVHGGGWQNGTKDGCPPLRGGYLDRGYAVASIGYRLSQHAVFPAQIEDCKSAIRWLRAHAKEYGLDPNRFGVWGSSAGGHLVALIGTSGDVKAFDVGANLDQSSRVQAVCDYYGPTDFTQMDAHAVPGAALKHDDANSPEAKLIGGPVQANKEKAAQASPLTYVSKDDPAFLIVHGDKDPAVPIHQSELLFAALKKDGVSVHFHTIHGAGHGGPGFNAAPVPEMVTTFFDQKLKMKSAGSEATTSESTTTATEQKPPTTAAGPQGRPKFDDILQRSDTNKDGKISREEFRGPAPLFDRLDANKDGFITREEHEAVGR